MVDESFFYVPYFRIKRQNFLAKWPDYRIFNRCKNQTPIFSWSYLKGSQDINIRKVSKKILLIY
jgi:hypothetical protein